MNIEQLAKKATNELKKSNIKTVSLDVMLLLEKTFKKDRSYILTHDLEPLINSEYSKFRKLLLRRKKGEPIAYILGHKEFYGYDFLVNKNVLIPRPETELLVENAIKFIKCHLDESARKQSGLPQSQKRLRNNRNRNFNIIDVGTGSGCIIISLLKELKNSNTNYPPLTINCYASDISKKALYVAKKNVKLYKINKQIRFFYSDLFSNSRMPNKYDLIIANLPYVPKSISNLKSHTSNLKNGIYFEPEKAIFAENNGTEIIKRFLDQAKNRINKNGLILIEVDPRNAKELLNYAKNIYKKNKVELSKDLSQKIRDLIIST